MTGQRIGYSPRMIALYVCWKRRKGQPVELAGVTSGGVLQALFLAKEIADKNKIPQSWVEMKWYHLSRRSKAKAVTA